MSTTYTSLIVHAVFSTKYRTPAIGPAIQAGLYAYIVGIVRQQKGKLLEIGGMPDHVHILLQINPSISISELLQHVKGSSSRWLQTLDTTFAWQRGYGAFSVSKSNVDRVRRYIQKQEEHHRNESFETELIRLLRKHNIPK